MVITLNICKICVHSHKNYLVYKNLCKVCLITCKLQGKCTYVTYIHHIFLKSRENLHISIFVAFCGREIWEILILTVLNTSSNCYTSVNLGNFPIGTHISHNFGYSLAN